MSDFSLCLYFILSPLHSLSSLLLGLDLDKTQEWRDQNCHGNKVSRKFVFRFLVAFFFRVDMVLEMTGCGGYRMSDGTCKW